MSFLRIKGARPRSEEGSNRILSHDGSGVVYNPTTVNENGNPVVEAKAALVSPQGALIGRGAREEYRLMQAGSAGDGFETDYPIAIGTWNKKTYLALPIGFVIAGMRAQDVRININGRLDLDHLLFDVATGKMLKTSQKMGEEIYERIGQSIRAYHDAGYFHGYPHNGNWGVEMSPSGEIRAVLRDLDSTMTRENMEGKELQRVEATWRFLDMERIIADLSSGGIFGYKTQDKPAIKDIRLLVESFLKGYFYNISPRSDEFSKLLEDATSKDFPVREIRQKIFRKDIILNRNEPVYGNIWGHLYDLSSSDRAMKADQAMTVVQEKLSDFKKLISEHNPIDGYRNLVEKMINDSDLSPFVSRNEKNRFKLVKANDEGYTQSQAWRVYYDIVGGIAENYAQKLRSLAEEQTDSHLYVLLGGLAKKVKDNPKSIISDTGKWFLIYNTPEALEYMKYPVFAKYLGIAKKAIIDSAMTIQENGGIDLTSANMNLQIKVIDSRFRGNDNGKGGNDNGIIFRLDPAQLQQLQNAPGFVPVIINIQPMTNLRIFLGLTDNQLTGQEVAS